MYKFCLCLSISCVGYYASKLIERAGYHLSITHLSYRYKKTTNKMIIFGQTLNALVPQLESLQLGTIL